MDPVVVRILCLRWKISGPVRLKSKSLHGIKLFDSLLSFETVMRVGRINVFKYSCSENINLVLEPIDETWPKIAKTLRKFGSPLRAVRGTEAFVISRNFAIPTQLEVRLKNQDGCDWDTFSDNRGKPWTQINKIQGRGRKKTLREKCVYLFSLVIEGVCFSKRRQGWYCRPLVQIKSWTQQ